jgi:hypothetical protein
MTSAYGAYHARPPFGRAGAKPARPQPGARAAQAAPDTVQTQAATRFAAGGEFAIGNVLRNAFAAPGANFITFVALIALACMPERILYHTIWHESLAMNALLRFTLMMSGFLLQLAVIRLALDAFAGRQASFGACIAQALRSFFPILGIGFVAALPVAGAFLLLLVPGVMLAMAWSLAVPVRIAEGAGIIACLKRSAELTRGHRWKILAVFLALGVGFVPVLLVMMPLWGMPLSGASIFLTTNWLARPLFDAAAGLVLAALYAELRPSVDLEAFD